MNNQLKLLIYIGFIVLIFYFLQDRFSLFDISFLDNNEVTSEEEVRGEEVVIEDGDTSDAYVEIFRQESTTVNVNIEAADTQAKRQVGLSNRRYLGDYDGMLLIFDTKTSQSLWMKDMYISLDIIFIDEKGFIIDMDKNMDPCTDTYCPSIYSSSMYKYALEVNAGFCDLNGLKVGDSVVIHL